jgi:BON domain
MAMRKREIVLGCGVAFALACEMGPNDAEIASAVERTFNMDMDLRDEAIDVASVDGEVTLTGSVDSTAERAHAQSVAERVEGVRVVRNQLGVEEPAETAPVAAPPPAEQGATGSTTEGATTEGATPGATPTESTPTTMEPSVIPNPPPADSLSPEKGSIPDPRPQGSATDPANDGSGS